MDNLSQTMLNALVNANAKGQKANLDEILKEVLRQEIERGVNEIIGHELTAFLGYEKSTQGASKDLGNSRNGYYERMLNTSYGALVKKKWTQEERLLVTAPIYSVQWLEVLVSSIVPCIGQELGNRVQTMASPC